MQRVPIVALIAAAGCGAAAPRPVALSLPVHRYRLHNGMTAVLVPDPSATLATIVVRYGVGAVDDPVHQEGVAHLAAHLMYDQRPGGTTLATQLERVAIQLDVEPRSTWTGFFARFAPEHLDAVLKLEAARLAMRCGRIDEAAFAAERANVAGELSTHASWRLNRMVGEAIYPASDPMRRAYAADAATVGNITRTEACAFIDRRYAPGNATIVVTGPIAPAELERAVGPLADVPARSFDPPAAMLDRPLDPAAIEIAADVAEPTLAVAFPLPSDTSERERALVLLDQVATATHAGEFGDGRSMVLWIRLAGATVEAKRAELADALAGSVDALAEHARPRRTERRPVARYTPEFENHSRGESFERVRARQLADDLAALDNAKVRLISIAQGTDLDAILAAHARIDGEGLRHTLATTLDASHAKPIVLRPDETRPPTRLADLVEPTHGLRRPLELDAASASVRPQVPASVLAHAQATRLDNGLTVVLAPSSTIPVVNVRLVFDAGTVASPLHRTANVAIAALMWAVMRASTDRGFQTHWSATWESVDLSFSCPASEIETRLEWFAGLRETTRTFAESAARALASARRTSTASEGEADRDDVFRAHLYGDHPYGAPRSEAVPARAPTAGDVDAFYRQFLQPDHATLIVTGGFMTEPVEHAIHRVFASWTGSARSPVIAKPERRQGSAVAMTEALPVIELRLGWLGGAPDDDHAAREIAVEMIDRLSPRAHCWYEARRLGGHYEVRGEFEPRSAATDIAGLRDAIAALGDGSEASKELFAVARRAVAIRTAAGPVSSQEWAADLARTAGLGRDLQWRQQLAQRVASTEYDDAKRIIASELVPGAATWLIVGPAAVTADVYARLGLTPEAR